VAVREVQMSESVLSTLMVTLEAIEHDRVHSPPGPPEDILR